MKQLQTLALLFGSLCAFACAAAGAGENASEKDTAQGSVFTNSTAFAGDALATCESSVVGEPLLRRLSAREFQASLDAAFPSVQGMWNSSFSPDPISRLGFDNEAEKLLVSKQTARELSETAGTVAALVKKNIEEILPCAVSSADRVCAGEYIARIGRRLFRRPLPLEEQERYLQFYDQVVTTTAFPEAIAWLTRALIMAPASVYRSEIGFVSEGQRPLTQFEIATALAFTFSGAPPNDALLDQAERGELFEPVILRQIAANLLETPQGSEQLLRFFGAFLEYPRVTSLSKADAPEFESLREDLAAETSRFIEAVVVEGRGGLQELLTDPRTFPSQAAAKFYGLEVPSQDFFPVLRPPEFGIGVLAQSSILATEASPDASSPTQRGLLVYERFLCGIELSVPPDIPDIPPVIVGANTTRERYELQHAAAPGCNSCHREFDPIGFGFEYFDALGRYRSDEGGLPIDSTGVIPNTDIAFTGQAELVRGLASMNSVGLCVSSQLSTFAFGNEAGCLGELERMAFVEGSIGFIEYLASLAVEPNFIRRTEDGSSLDE